MQEKRYKPVPFSLHEKRIKGFISVEKHSFAKLPGEP